MIDLSKYIGEGELTHKSDKCTCQACRMKMLKERIPPYSGNIKEVKDLKKKDELFLVLSNEEKKKQKQQKGKRKAVKVVHPVSTEIHSSAYRHKEIIVATPLTTDDAPVPGNSGAMVIDDKGALVGILMGGSGSQVLITPISKVLTFYKTTIKAI